MSKNKRNIITLELPEEIRLQLKQIADKNERSLSAQIRLIIKNFLGTQKND